MDGFIARAVSPTDDHIPPKEVLNGRVPMAPVFTTSASYRAYCHTVIGFFIDDINPLIFIAKFSSLMFGFCVVWPIQRVIHDDKNTHNNLVIKQKV